MNPSVEPALSLRRDGAPKHGWYTMASVPMEILPSSLPGVCQVLLPRFQDDRGWFAEAWNAAKFAGAGLPEVFAQDNQSFSRQNVLRGLHYQLGQPQGKLVRVLQGQIFDVAVDIRRGSPDFGRHATFTLSAPRAAGDPLQLLWIPEGFAHGFLVLSDSAEVLYKTTAGYYPQGERTLVWNDAEIGIEWPLAGEAPIVSAKDAEGLTLAEALRRGDLF
jgi:dTDP-4-dehydrorhamnose 3,5-epimerase